MMLGRDSRPFRTRFLFAVCGLVAVFAGAVVTGAGCSNQGEGQRCSHLGDNGGNDDCQAGLICRQPTELAAAQDDLCCPAEASKVTVPACQPAGGGVAVTPPNDSGPADTGSADTSTADTSTPDTSTADTSTPDTSTPDASNDAADGAD